MKYKTFRALIIAAILVSGGIAVYVLGVALQRSSADAGPVAPAGAVEASPRELATSPSDATPPSDGAPNELREVDTLMLALLQRPVQDKIKDASKGRPFKINLYSDDGTRFNRAKVDLDRDDRWDEKWTFKPDGSTEREVAPNDDENYQLRFVLEAGRRWQPIDAP